MVKKNSAIQSLSKGVIQKRALEEKAIRSLMKPDSKLMLLSDLKRRIDDMIKTDGDVPVYKYHIATIASSTKTMPYIRFSKWFEIVKTKLHKEKDLQ